MASPLAFLVFFVIAVAGRAAGHEDVRAPEGGHGARGRRGIEPTEHMPTHPSLAFHDLIKRLGNFVPQSPKDVTVMQRRLIRAGIRNENALKILYGAKAVLRNRASAADRAGGRGSDRQPIPATRFIVVLVAAAVGFFGPNEYVRRMAAKRAERDRARSGQRARSAGGLRRVRTGSRSGDFAGFQGTGTRPSGDQRRIRTCQPRIESRQAARRGAAQSGANARRSTI